MNPTSKSLKMDAELAKQLYESGAVLIIAGVPVGTEFGIDLCQYKVGEKFRGIKMIVPGFHYFWCAAQGPYGDAAPRVSFAHYFKPNEIIIREWDQATEQLRERICSNPEEEKRCIRENMQGLDTFLAPYDLRFLKEWKLLSGLVTEPTLKLCSPSSGIIRTNIELQSCPDSERPRGTDKTLNTNLPKHIIDESELLPKLKPVEGTAPRFTIVPDRIPRGATPSDISRHSIDCIDSVRETMSKFSNANILVEEIQLSFVFYLIGHSVESLAQWRRLLNLFCNSETAVLENELFYEEYCKVLVFQLPHLPEELLMPTPFNTVYKDIRNLLRNLYVNGLISGADLLVSKLKSKLKWDFKGLLDEDPEDKPVIVQL